MTNNITKEQINDLLKIQKEFDDRIETKNLEDTVAALIIEFTEWINTLEFFKNWKKKPGKPKEVQLDEMADFLAFSLQLFLALTEDEDKNVILKTMEKQINEQELPEFRSISFIHTLGHILGQFTNEIDESVIGVICLPFIYSKTYYSTDELIAAYKKKMGVNHARQDGTADTEKGYI
mgnify:CR=1 FL=1